MKKTTLILAAVAALAFTGCGDDKTPAPAPVPAPAPQPAPVQGTPANTLTFDVNLSEFTDKEFVVVGPEGSCVDIKPHEKNPFQHKQRNADSYDVATLIAAGFLKERQIVRYNSNGDLSTKTLFYTSEDCSPDSEIRTFVDENGVNTDSHTLNGAATKSPSRFYRYSDTFFIGDKAIEAKHTYRKDTYRENYLTYYKMPALFVYANSPFINTIKYYDDKGEAHTISTYNMKDINKIKEDGKFLQYSPYNLFSEKEDRDFYKGLSGTQEEVNAAIDARGKTFNLVPLKDVMPEYGKKNFTPSFVPDKNGRVVFGSINMDRHILKIVEVYDGDIKVSIARLFDLAFPESLTAKDYYNVFDIALSDDQIYNGRTRFLYRGIDKTISYKDSKGVVYITTKYHKTQRLNNFVEISIVERPESQFYISGNIGLHTRFAGEIDLLGGFYKRLDL